MNDDAKRRLLTAAAAYIDGAGDAVEKERLSEFHCVPCVGACVAGFGVARSAAVGCPPLLFSSVHEMSDSCCHLPAATCLCYTTPAGVLVPPSAEQRPKLLTQHNDIREDKYYWLRDDERKDPAVISYLESENGYMSAAMADTEGLQAELYREMRGRIKEEDSSVATRCVGVCFVSCCVV